MANLPHLTKVPSLLRFFENCIVMLQRGSDAVEGGLVWLENWLIFLEQRRLEYLSPMVSEAHYDVIRNSWLIYYS